MATNQHEDNKSQRDSNALPSQSPENRADAAKTREAPATVNVSIDLRGTDPDRVSGLISRIFAAVADGPTGPEVNVDVHAAGQDGSVDEATDADDPLAAFPTEREPPAPARPSQRQVTPQAARQAEKPFEWYVQPAAGPLVRRGEPDRSGQATPRAATMGAALGRASSAIHRGCSRLRQHASATATRVKTSAVLGEWSRASVRKAGLLTAAARNLANQARAATARVAATGIERTRRMRARSMRGAVGVGAGALLLLVTLLALLPTSNLPARDSTRDQASPPVTGPAPGLLSDSARTDGAPRVPAMPIAAKKGGHGNAGGLAATPPGTSGGHTSRAVGPAPARDREDSKPETAKRNQARLATRGSVVGPKYVGGLSVSSTPPGAAVTVNDRHVGTTPVRVRRLPVGTYAVRVVLDGFERWSRAVQVSSGREVVVRPTLRRERAPATRSTSGGSR